MQDRFVVRRARNFLHTVALIASMVGLLAALGWVVTGSVWIVLVAGAVGLLFLAGPQLSPVFVLRLYRARRLGPYEAPELTRIVEALAQRSELERIPALYYVPTQIVNAFAVGSRRAPAIAVSDGLLRRLNRREITGVLAHEVSHIHSNDIRVMSLADTISRATGAVSWVGQMLLFLNLPLILVGQVHVPWVVVLLMIFAPTLSTLLQLALSRTREFDADLNAAYLTGDPRGLASALARMAATQGGFLERLLFPGRRVPEPSLLRTHPPTRERIDRLLELEEPAPAHRLQGITEARLADAGLLPVHTAVPRWRWVMGVWR